MIGQVRFPILLSLGALAILPAFSATVTYTDSTFTLANYNVIQGTSNATIAVSTVGGVFTADRTINAGGGFANFAAIHNGFVYETSMGTLNSIDVSALVTTDLSPWALFLEQAGSLYRASIPATPPGPSLSSQAGLTATSFQLVDLAANTVGAANPDFGAGFRLGFGQRRSAGGSLPSRIVFDDVNITLNVTPAPVPEPGSLGLLLGGLIACGMARRRR